jgi:hypothetical protein
MGVLDGLLGNLGGIDGLAERLNIPTDKVQELIGSVQGKLGSGEDVMGAISSAAQEHGISLENVQSMFGGSEGLQGMLGKASSFLDKDGDGNPLNDLGGLVSGFFGSKT